MSLPPNYVNTLQLIKILRSLRANGTPTQIGYTCDEIHAQHNAVFPDTPFTLAQTCSLLISGVKQGVFLYGGCSTGAVVPQNCRHHAVTANTEPTNQLFYINTAMACVNPINGYYVAVGYAPDPNVPRLGYLPCSFCSGGGVGNNPYAGSGASRGRPFGIGGSAGTPEVGGCPATLACGTCIQ